MDKNDVVRGASGGMLGGAMMALWAMATLWATGMGPWLPVNLIAHTFWRSAPLDGAFEPFATALGAAIHMAMSTIVGVVMALVAGYLTRFGRSRGFLAAFGAIFAWLVWEVMQLVVWRAIDPAAARTFTPWVFMTAHMVFGIVASLVLPATVAGRHAATHRVCTPPAAVSFPADEQRRPAHSSDPRSRGLPAVAG